MVWGGICATGKILTVFVERRVKINQTKYRIDIVEFVILPWAQENFENHDWISKHNSASPYKVKRHKSGTGPISRFYYIG